MSKYAHKAFYNLCYSNKHIFINKFKNYDELENINNISKEVLNQISDMLLEEFENNYITI